MMGVKLRPEVRSMAEMVQRLEEEDNAQST